jgi:hypothetical protein
VLTLHWLETSVTENTLELAPTSLAVIVQAPEIWVAEPDLELLLHENVSISKVTNTNLFISFSESFQESRLQIGSAPVAASLVLDGHRFGINRRFPRDALQSGQNAAIVVFAALHCQPSLLIPVCPDQTDEMFL